MIGKHLAMQQQKAAMRSSNANLLAHAASMQSMGGQAINQMSMQHMQAPGGAAAMAAMGARRQSAPGAPGGMNGAMVAAMIAARQQAALAQQRGAAQGPLPGQPQ